MWTCLLTQAGVSLGLASEVGVLFPAFGPKFQSALIAVILINQIVGPVLFRIGMRAVGEAGKGASAGDEWDEDADVPIALLLGRTPAAMSLAARLLGEHWSVTLVCASEEEARLASAEIAACGEEARAAAGAKAGKGRVAHVLRRLRSVGRRPAPGAASEQDVEAVAGGEAENSSLLAAAPQEAELDEHGHPLRRIEDSFRTVVLQLCTDAPEPATDPLPSVGEADGEQVPPAGEAGPPSPAASDALDTQIADLVAGLDVKRLSAFVFSGPDDERNLRCARSVRALADASAKASPLRSARLLALLRSPGWAGEFEKLSAMPLHCELHTTFLAARLLSSPPSRPVTLLQAAASLDDLCRSVGAVVAGDAQKGFAERYADPAEGSEQLRRSRSDVAGSFAAAQAEAKDLRSTMRSVAALVPRSLSQLKESVRSVVYREEVGATGLARREYLEQLSGLDENAKIQGALLGRVTERSRAEGLQEMAAITRARSYE